MTFLWPCNKVKCTEGLGLGHKQKLLPLPQEAEAPFSRNLVQGEFSSQIAVVLQEPGVNIGCLVGKSGAARERGREPRVQKIYVVARRLVKSQL